jgi:peptidoglycan hydrolase-like protein with peptidoglycan-binding domain
MGLVADRRRRRGSACVAVLVAVALAGSSAPVLAAPPALTATAHAATQAPLLTYGDRGPAVGEWQSRLNPWLRAEGRPVLVTDGIYGPRTRAATLNLQRLGGTTVDGIVGPRTRAALARLLRAADEAPFAGTVGVAEQAPVGWPVAVVGVRTGRHEGFDRIVFDLTSGGRPGWRVLYVDSPVRSQGSGAVVPLAGDARLQIDLRGIAMPGDAGGRHYPGPARPALGSTGVFSDLYVDNLFEGIFATYVGTSSPEPFRVFLLQNPQRLVVDVRHPR